MKISINKHLAIIGETQTGKTYLAQKIFKTNPIKSLFIDIEDIGDIKGQRVLTRNNREDVFDRTILKYHKVRYVPSSNDAVARREVRWIFNRLRKLNVPICVFVDEIQHYGTARKNAFDVYAIRGLKYGIHLVSISQRPAHVSKTIMTQTSVFIFFDVGVFERKYFREYNLPYDELLYRFKDAPKYSWIVYEKGVGIKGPYKI